MIPKSPNSKALIQPPALPRMPKSAISKMTATAAPIRRITSFGMPPFPVVFFFVFLPAFFAVKILLIF